ncbi:MAG: adenylate kinase [Planctomycetes bacterium]|nr:adenylate kinase [Planctomycetota bacterium]
MVFLGAPGAGKGTQAKQLAAGHGVLHISSGDMLREQVAAGTELGRAADTFMRSGQLVPDDVIIGMVLERIRRPDAARAWILDGFPRTLNQAEALDQALEQASLGLSHVFSFEVPHDVLVRRLTARWTCGSCGAIWNTEFKPPAKAGVCDTCGGALQQRSDDRPEAVTARLEVYTRQTAPLLDYYRSQGVLHDVDADRPPSDILADLARMISDPDRSPSSRSR